MKAREFLKVDVDWLSLVFDPCEPANRIPLTVELTSSEAKAKGMEFVEVACAAGFDENRSNFDRIVPISFVDIPKRMLYGIVFRANEVVVRSETEKFWSGPVGVRLMMEGFAERGCLGNVDSNHDGEKLRDVFVAEQGIVLAGDPRFDSPTDPHPENISAWWAGVKVKETPAGDKVMALIAEGKGRGFSLKGMAACGPEQDVEFTKGESAKMTKKAGDDSGKVSLASRITSAVLSVFSDKIEGVNDARRLEALHGMYCDSYWKIVQSPEIEDKETALAECLEDYRKAVVDGTEVKMAKIGTAKAPEPESTSADVALGAAARGLEVSLKGAKFGKASRDQIVAAHEILGKLRKSWEGEGEGGEGIAAGLTDGKQEGDEMDLKQVTELMAKALEPVMAKLTELAGKVEKPVEAKLSEADVAKIGAVEAKLTAVETKLTTIEAAQAKAPVTAEQQKAELTTKITEGETKVTELTAQIEAQKVQLAEQKVMLEKLGGQRPESRSAVPGAAAPDAAAPAATIKAREGKPQGVIY